MKFRTDHFTLGRIVLGLGALSFLRFVEADFAQCVPGWDWSYNSVGQNPCEIAGSLQAPCLGFSVFELGPLGPGSNYVSPQANDTAQKKCGCNTIIYSLYAACSVCQSNVTETPVTWASWSQFCDSVYVAQYPFPIPYNASVPHWAFVNYTDSGFDITRAQAAGRDPEATPTAPPIVSLSSTTSINPSGTSQRTDAIGTGTPSTPSSTSNGGSGGGGNSKTSTGAIAGGVVGGVVGLAGLAGLAFFFLKRRGGGGNPNSILGPNHMTYNPTLGQQNYEPPKLYNPADPSTFPTSVSGGDSSHSGGGNYTTNPHQPGRYNGAAEL